MAKSGLDWPFAFFHFLAYFLSLRYEADRKKEKGMKEMGAKEKGWERRNEKEGDRGEEDLGE